MTAGADWDAVSYRQVAQPHARWGASVVDRVQLRGDETVLDAGCGAGGVTGQLILRLPRGRVIAADRSPAMLAAARTALAAYADQVSFLETDLLLIDERLGLASVDVVFSTATFHWIADHTRLYAALRGVLREGGQLVAQYGGGANLAGFMAATDAVAAREPYRQYLQGKDLWRFYYSPEETREAVLRAVFSSVDAWLEPSPQTFDTREALTTYARTVVLRNHVDALPATLRPAFEAAVVDAIVSRLGGLVLDYVRLNVVARA